eukprot:4463276-Pleurochrysis_carterae.AAC.1
MRGAVCAAAAVRAAVWRTARTAAASSAAAIAGADGARVAVTASRSTCEGARSHSQRRMHKHARAAE